METLPKSCVLPIDFKSSDPHHAAGGFADVWKGTYDGKEVAFKSIRGSTLTDDAARLKRKVRYDAPPIRHPSDTVHCFRGGFVKRWYYGSR